MKIQLTISASIALGTILPLGAVDIEPITYNKNIWTLTPEQISSRFPDYQWRSADNNQLTSQLNDLKFMGMTIKSASLIPIDGKTQAIEFLIFKAGESPPIGSTEFSSASLTWKQHIDQGTGAVGRRLPIVSKNNHSIQRTSWEFNNSVAVLSSVRSSVPHSLKLTILPKDIAEDFIKNAAIDDPFKPQETPADNTILANLKGNTSYLKNKKFVKQDIPGTPEYFLLYFSASW